MLALVRRFCIFAIVVTDTLYSCSNGKEIERGFEMTRQHVVRIYQLLATHGIKIWVDGGFCVEALVGRATRKHGDLDIAVERADAERLCAVLADDGFVLLPRGDSSA